MINSWRSSGVLADKPPGSTTPALGGVGGSFAIAHSPRRVAPVWDRGRLSCWLSVRVQGQGELMLGRSF